MRWRKQQPSSCQLRQRTDKTIQFVDSILSKVLVWWSYRPPLLVLHFYLEICDSRKCFWKICTLKYLVTSCQMAESYCWQFWICSTDSLQAFMITGMISTLSLIRMKNKLCSIMVSVDPVDMIWLTSSPIFRKYSFVGRFSPSTKKSASENTFSTITVFTAIYHDGLALLFTVFCHQMLYVASLLQSSCLWILNRYIDAM